MASSLFSPGLRFAANEMILSLRKDIAKVTQFTTNFTSEAAQKGSTLLVPIVSDEEASSFDRETNNYGTVDGTIKYVPMTFNIHAKHSFGFTENDFNLVNGTSFWARSGEASARAVSRKIASTVGGLITATNIPTAGDNSVTYFDGDGNEQTTANGKFGAYNEVAVKGELTKAKVAGFRAACKAADIPVGDTILALNSVKFAELLALLDANMYGGTEAIRDGLIPFLYGYKAVMELDDLNDENLIGALIPSSAVAIASRILPVGNPKLYDEVGTTTDDKSELTIQFRRGGDWKTGDSVATAEVLFGAKLIQPTKIVRLVSSAG